MEKSWPVLARKSIRTFSRELWSLSSIESSVLAMTSAALGWYSYRKQRFVLFVFGVLGAYIALIEWTFKLRLGDGADLLLAGLLSVALMAVLWKAHRKLKETV